MTTAVQATTQQRPWWLTLITGILALVVGGILLWSPAKDKIETYLIVVMALGFYWLLEGTFHIVGMFLDHTMWGLKLFLGIIGIWAGMWVLTYPVAAAITLPKVYVLVLGVWGFINGIMLLFMAFRGGGWGAGIMGVLGLIFGTVLMMNYYVLGMGLTALWIAAWAGVIFGIVLIVQAFRQRKES
jgi:uncharacterized membrane protein HdeD (DUF308 family)